MTDVVQNPDTTNERSRTGLFADALRRVTSTQTSLDLGRKVTCYLSAELLMGPQLGVSPEK
jgi:glycogen phosphorylase